MGNKVTQIYKDLITQSLVSQTESDTVGRGECLKCVKLRNVSVGKNGGREINWRLAHRFRQENIGA